MQEAIKRLDVLELRVQFLEAGMVEIKTQLNQILPAVHGASFAIKFLGVASTVAGLFSAWVSFRGH